MCKRYDFFHQLMRLSQAPQAEDLTGTARRDLHDCLRRTLAAHLNLRPKSQAFLDEVQASTPHIKDGLSSTRSQ